MEWYLHVSLLHWEGYLELEEEYPNIFCFARLQPCNVRPSALIRLYQPEMTLHPAP